MPPTTTTKSAPRKYGGKSKWDLRALGVSTKASKKSKASATNAKSGATKPAVATKPANAKPSATKASHSIDTNDDTMNMNINKESLNMDINSEGGKVQDKGKVQDQEVMEMFRKFEEAQAAEAQAAGGVDGCSEASKACIASEPSTASNDKPSFDFGTSEPSNAFGRSDSTNAFGSSESTNALAIPEPSNIFDDNPSFDFGVSDSSSIFGILETSNIFGLRESPDIFDDKPSFNFATTSSGDLILLNSQGTEVSVLATYAIPSKDRLPTFEGEVDFFRDWTQEQLDEEQHTPIDDRKAARLRLRRKRFDFVGGPGYRVYLARRERRLTEDEDDFLPRKRMHTTQDLANMRAKWKVRRERPLRERAMRRCLRERAVRRGKEVGEVRVVGAADGEDKGWKVVVGKEADIGMGDDGCQVDEVYVVGGEEQAMGEDDHSMGNVWEGEGKDEDHPMDDGEEDDDDDDDPDTPRAPFRRESTPEPEGEEDWIM